MTASYGSYGARSAPDAAARHDGAADEPAALMLRLDQRKLPALLYQRLSKVLESKAARIRRNEEAFENFGKPGRDPVGLMSVLDGFAQAHEWGPHLKVARLANDWEGVVGKAIADHCRVLSFRDGVLTVQAQSPVWATQLNYMIPQLKARIQKELEGVVVERIVVRAPTDQTFTRGKWTGLSRRYTRGMPRPR